MTLSLVGLEQAKAKRLFLETRDPKEIEELGAIEGDVSIPISQRESRWDEIPADSLLVPG